MSLINQMLRDLESRRKVGDRQLPSGEKPAVTSAQTGVRRPLILLLCGLLLVGLIWLTLDFFGRQMSAPQASVKQVLPAESAARIAIQAKPARPVAGKPVAAKPVSVEEPPEVKKNVSQQKTAVTQKQAAPAAKVESKTAAPALAQLLRLNLLEAGGSVRVMLEFEQLPAYSWGFLDKDKQQLQVQFRQAVPQVALSVPTLKGPLLSQLGLQREKQDLQLLVTANQPLTLELLKLPADHLHGPRLLLELTPELTAAAVVESPEGNRPAPAAEKKAEPAKPASPAKRVSKTVTNLTATEQAGQAYRVALQQLQRGEALAAEASLAHALTLQPGLLDARLQLVELMQTAGRNEDAEKQLLEGLKLYPMNPELRKGYARRLMGDGHQEAAIDLLQSAPRPAIGSDLEYHALLAALLQELGRHPAAAEKYRQLLSYRPQAALWWVGLAISLDQSGRGGEAKEAYQQALALPGLRDDLKNYAQNRLQTL